ncbi:SH3 domain-containing protein [Gigaspora margarita]|uniref:SH3 domain-containing protein n=2 Tax=Gigaspora margarita TaxID=4874 RepID=A0A8H4ETD4_GIGMA|nr:SH3 domain-containing protein [Gigaspora margarita]
MTFDLGLIVGNPFYLATLGLAAVGWIVEFAGAAASQIKGIAWFYIIYELCLIIGILIAIATNALSYYRSSILTFLAVGIIFQIQIIDGDIGVSIPEFQAFAAGALFIAIVSFVWVIAFGAEDGSLVGGTINSWSISNKPNNPRNVHPDVGFPPGVQISPGPGQIPMTNMQDQVIVSPNADYAYKAKALYDYQASPEDQTELSFTKGEILDIVDNKGKWWQAKKADGTIGIAPSNYLQII